MTPLEHFFKVLSIYIKASIRIRPHQSERKDPDPHQSDKQDPDPSDADPQHWPTGLNFAPPRFHCEASKFFHSSILSL